MTVFWFEELLKRLPPPREPPRVKYSFKPYATRRDPATPRAILPTPLHMINFKFLIFERENQKRGYNRPVKDVTNRYENVNN